MQSNDDKGNGRAHQVDGKSKRLTEHMPNVRILRIMQINRSRRRRERR